MVTCGNCDRVLTHLSEDYYWCGRCGSIYDGIATYIPEIRKYAVQAAAYLKQSTDLTVMAENLIKMVEEC